MKTFLTLAILLLLHDVNAQNCVIRFVATEKSTKTPISRVCIQQIVSGKLTNTQFTNSKGYAYFNVTDFENSNFTYNHIAYLALDEFDRKVLIKNKLDTLDIPIRFYFNKEHLLDEVVIKPVGKPDTVFESARVSVSDFEFMPSGNLLLLTYPKNLKKGTELVLFDGLSILSYIPIEESGIELIRDYKQNAHVVCEKNIFGIIEEANKIQLYKIDRPYFEAYIKPIVDSVHSSYIFSNFNPNYPAFSYYSYEPVDSVYKKICDVKDELMMELYRSEFKYVDVRTKIWAKEKEKETGIDKEIWVGMNYFTSSIYYKELYAPLFRKNNAFLLFDHYKNFMYSYDLQGNIVDSIPLYYHLRPNESGWKNQMIQDSETGEIYVCFEVGAKSLLRRFDTVTGKLSSAVELYFNYPQNIQIRNGFAYYIYRPFESMQKKYLYKERLSFDRNN